MNARDGACLTSYTGARRFIQVSVGLLIPLPAKMFDVLVYFSRYLSSLRMRPDPVSVALALKRDMKLNWEKTATTDGFMRDGFASREMHWL